MFRIGLLSVLVSISWIFGIGNVFAAPPAPKIGTEQSSSFQESERHRLKALGWQDLHEGVLSFADENGRTDLFLYGRGGLNWYLIELEDRREVLQREEKRLAKNGSLDLASRFKQKVNVAQAQLLTIKEMLNDPAQTESFRAKLVTHETRGLATNTKAVQEKEEEGGPCIHWCNAGTSSNSAWADAEIICSTNQVLGVESEASGNVWDPYYEEWNFEVDDCEDWIYSTSNYCQSQVRAESMQAAYSRARSNWVDIECSVP